MRFKEHARKIGRAALSGAGWTALGLGTAWAVFALWLDVSKLLAVVFIAVCVGLLVRLRPLWRARLAVAGLVLVVIAGWNLIPARNDRDWAPEVARPARATIAGNRLTIENVRNFEYRSGTDFTERWETRSYDLGKLRGVDMFICYWGSSLIAHTITGWQFENGPPLAISIETRKEKGETYSALRGFFRQFELYYVVADERDLIRLRTNFRGERVYLYHMRVTPEAARAVLLDYLERINHIAEQPRWYNAISQNCTTTIRQHVLHVGGGNPWDWRILANGHIDELGYERGTIATSALFAEIKKRSEITEKSKSADTGSDYSTKIRKGLPE